ncbi:PREDICTED: uncharacterized protein LOC109593786 [Amphimedon queenslandica]|uniref:Uncharacterized protein n=1 Tax=Amphimedon queenslandica TaxID=400682 RepID=A0AAN0K558_AMPQE|nr:PREDICTED: uncharacterized protein LOC109593786 [Amphimedon queenslandica]|eukprot:XP_019864446.1 PREDICTED: uncharacterized protein LOC109593786 [Amphimedon queenslandica]
MKFPDSQFCFWYLVFALAILFISDLKYCLCFTTAMTQVSMHLHFVTTSVISTDSNVVLLPWTIIQFNESYSVLDFFLVAVKPWLDNEDCTLHSARFGHEMHSLVHVDTNLPLIAIVPSHGK